ncbi:THUMP-like domain-containing protein [Streptomyces sp. CA-253872]|uniref:THUMP-like domain-containing protein n=1 Tax=Streptomyces sp. CA-253872 TaxID=3240067 RepID=UPI003D94EE68
MDLDDLSALRTPEGSALLTALRGLRPADELATLTRLRRAHPPALVTAALAQARLRDRAVAKFGAEDAARMWFTPGGVEQATRAPVAAYRARRFGELGARRVADLCCGIGGDALALARAGIAVRAVDRDPLTAAVARANAEALGLAELIEVECADVTEVDAGDCDTVFADPARRGGRGRVFDPESYAPPLSWAIGAARRGRLGALKVAPGVPHEAIPSDAAGEWVSDGGELKEAVLWFGTGTGTTATLLPGPHHLRGTGLPNPPAARVARYLYEPDAAVIRAHLVAEVARDLDATLIDDTLAYLTSDTLTPTPYARPYEITDVLPFGVKRLKSLLRERGVGTLTVKKRGSAMEPEELRRQVKPKGPNAAVVFMTRELGAPVMLVGRGV